MKKETKLGFFIFIGLLAILTAILLTKNISFTRGFKLYVDFDEASGLLEKSWVRVSGVKVGVVNKIELVEDKARVTVILKHKLNIHEDAQSSIGSTGLLGVKYVDLTLGSESKPLLKEGEVIQGITPLSLDKMFSELSATLKSITGKGTMGEKLNDILSNADEISKKVNTSLSAEKLNKFVDDMTSAAASIRKLSSDIAEISSEEKTDIKTIIKNLRSSTDKLDRILEKVSTGEGAIGKLLSDKEMGAEIKTTVTHLREASDSAKKTIARFTLFKTYWDYEMRYGQLFSEYKSDVGIQIRPRPDKFYFLGIANAGTDSAGPGEKKNTLNFKIGRDIISGDKTFATGYAGVLRSTGGFGFGVRPLYKWNPWNRLEFYGEAYDFARTTPSNEVKPRVIAGARVYPAKWLRVGGSIEDAAVDKNVHINANVMIEDEDLAYFLALIGLARP